MQLSFSNSVPEVLLDNPDVQNYLAMLDALYAYKKDALAKASRYYNPVLLTDPKFLVRKVNELGLPEVPVTFPKIVLDNLYLSGEDIVDLMGSKIGLDWLLRALTCGEPTIDDSHFYPRENYIVLSDLENGYLPASSDYPNDFLYLFSGIGDFTGGSITIGIATPFWNFTPITDYIRNNIRVFLGFTDLDHVITINFVDGPFVRNPYMYEYFSKVI